MQSMLCVVTMFSFEHLAVNVTLIGPILVSLIRFDCAHVGLFAHAGVDKALRQISQVFQYFLIAIDLFKFALNQTKKINCCQLKLS